MKKNCVWNPSIYACECNNYTENVVDILILIYEDRKLNNTLTINTSLPPIISSYPFLLLLLLVIIIIACISVILRPN